MNVYLKKGFTYIPQWNNNKKQKKDNQIKVHFEFLSGEKMSDIWDENGKVDKLKDWLSVCVSIENLKVNDVEVTPEGLFKIQGLEELYLECKLAYRNETVFDKKK